jgi:Pyruvate/2-oxoacid:ferredoxin oxidoreductase gamma subunit
MFTYDAALEAPADFVIMHHAQLALRHALASVSIYLVNSSLFLSDSLLAIDFFKVQREHSDYSCKTFTLIVNTKVFN